MSVSSISSGSAAASARPVQQVPAVRRDDGDADDKRQAQPAQAPASSAAPAPGTGQRVDIKA